MTRFLGDGTYMTGKDYQIGSFQSAPFMGNLPLTDPSKFERTPNPEEYITSNHNAKENIYAAYLRWDQNITEDLLFITGLRMEFTRINHLGHTLIDEEQGGDITDTSGYANWFPNLTSRYSPVDRANIPPTTSMSWVATPMRIATTERRASLTSMPMSSYRTISRSMWGGNNLLNQPLFYYQGQRDHVMQVELYKPSVTAGLKWTL